MVRENAKKKKYSRDGENPVPWRVAALGMSRAKDAEAMRQAYKVDPQIGTWEEGFYPASEFNVKNSLYSKGVSLNFPEYMLVSRNYYERGWGLKTHRRLKNVIVVMDFAPSKANLREVASVGKAFTPQQERNLMRAFTVADANQSGGISVTELKEVLKAIDVDVDTEGKQFLASMHQGGDLNRDGSISFEELKKMLTQRKFYRVQGGRFYVAMSLFEAECMRAALHNQFGAPLVPGKDTIAALRTGRTLLDASTGFESAQSFQENTCHACFRFIDSAVNYMPSELNLLLRALQNNSCESRASYFMEVRTNRRRKQQDPSTTSLSKVFVTSDEHHMLQYRLATGRITATLKSRGIYPRDAFAAFDNNRDGLVSAPELWRGLDWLGLKIDQVLIRDFFREVDKDKDGFINLEEFKGAVGWNEEEEGGQGMGTFQGAPILPPVPIPGDKKAEVKIPPPVLNGIKLKVRKITKFQKLWNSQGSMSRQKVSVWEPIIQSGAFHKNKAFVTIGHYAMPDFENPNRDGKDRLSLEITDTTGSFVGGSSWLPHVLSRYMPHPARFRLAWSLTHGSNPFYAWEPVPPSEEYVALGFIGTTTDKPPDVQMMRCVCKDWVRESTFVHSIWNDSGSGGREGSIWLFNTLNLIGFVAGHDPPRKRPWDLKSQRFFLRDYSDTKVTNGVAPSAGVYKHPR